MLPADTGIQVPAETAEKDLQAPRFAPKSQLGRTLLKARREYIQQGGKLMDWDEINAEVRPRRT